MTKVALIPYNRRKIIPNNIHYIRHIKDLSMQELATATGINANYLGGIANYHHTPSLINAFLIAGALGTTIEKVFTFNTEAYCMLEYAQEKNNDC